MTSSEEMLNRLGAALAAGASATELPLRACTAALEALDCDEGALTVGDLGAGRATLCTIGDTAEMVDDAEGLAGQGPSVEAFRTDRYVHMQVDGDDDELSDRRWLMLSLTALRDVGPLVVHALPLRVPTGVIGVLTLVRRGREEVPFDGVAAQHIADVVAASVMASTPSDPGDTLGTQWIERAEVFQATGMVMAQMHLGEDDALLMLRGHSFVSGTSLYTTAQQVLSRQLRFDRRTEEGTQA